MYEQFRNDVIRELGFEQAMAQRVLDAIDRVASRYEISKKETSLVPIGSGLPEIAKTYLSCKIVAGQSKGTLKNFKTLLTHFFEDVGKPVGEITANDIRMWLYNYKSRTNVADNTLDKYRGNLYSFFQWCVDEEYIQTNPAKKVQKIKCVQKERVALNQIDLEYIRHACGDERDRLAVELLYSTGCRVSEVVNIKLSDIDMYEGTVKVFGKGKKERTVYLNAKAIVAIKEYMDVRQGNSEYLITSAYKPYNKIGSGTLERIVRLIHDRASEVTKRVSPHVFRHTTATTMLNNGGDITAVSKMLGHENVQTTMLYAKMSEQGVHTQHSKCVI